jgi:hypothetical protein
MVNKPLFKEIMMNKILRIAVLAATIGIPFSVAQASRDGDTANLFRDSDQSSAFFQKSYGYAVFPTIGKGGLGIGAAHGSGHVYADVGAVAITAAADVSVGTTGADAGASAGKRAAATASEFNRGMAVFTIAKGGLMYNATLAGQKFSYTTRSPQ